MSQNREALNVAGAFVATGLIAILGFVTWALVFTQVPADNQNALTLLIGILSANVGTLVGFFFGSSQTNKKQAESIDKLVSTNAALGPAPENLVPVSPGESVTVKADEERP